MDKASSEDFLTVTGNKALNGDVLISGAKNSALKKMAAALVLGKGKVTLRNVPDLTDIDNMSEIIRFLGGTVEKNGSTVIIDSTDLSSEFVPYELASKFRASFIVLGALVARFKKAKVSLPGGCNIGARKLDLHYKGLKALGTTIKEDQGYVFAEADKLIGNRIYLDIPSNGATENILLASVLAEGETVVENAACDPEIVDLAEFLNAMGCDIRGAGTSTIHIHGKKIEELHDAEHSTIPDRIEAATYLLAGMVTKGKVTIKGVIEEDLHALLSKIEEVGAEVIIKPSTCELYGIDNLVDITVDASKNELKGVDVTTIWYPGFPTDVQAQITSLLAVCTGTSTVTETIYEARFQYVEELQRMGANITVNGKVAIIKGVEEMTGAKVKGKDLRSTAALVVAAFAAKGTSQIFGLEFLDRGYEHLVEKFLKIGADIKRSKESDNYPSINEDSEAIGSDVKMAETQKAD